MSRFTRPVAAGLILLALAANTVQAQFVVHDPVNYVQALLRYARLLEQYRFWVRQARRLPIDMLERYGVPETRWRHHDAAGEYPYARPLLSALNFGDTGGAGYRQATDRLDSLDEILSTVPTDLRRRLSTTYGTIEFADSVARMGIHQVGAIRSNGKKTLAAIERMESDSAVPNESYNSQAALLNKINAANVLDLRINETTNQFLMHMLEQLIVQNKRTRDAEAQVMDARLFQWRYGSTYGRDLFSKTAAKLDAWRQP